jgi:ABC-type uncharacterized transport system substrate-binding protein
MTQAFVARRPPRAYDGAMTARAFITAPLALAAFAAYAPIASAHPHIFVDTGVELIHDDNGRLTALRIHWTYDELFSLLLLEDLGLDDDYDGVLTEAETEALQGFDMQWPEGFEGDVYVTAGGAPVALGPPETGPAELRPDGMLTSTHTRPLARPVDSAAEAVVVSVYDPTFYTAYSILPAEVSTDAPGCETAVFTPDLDAAYAQLEAALAELGAVVDDPFEAVDFPPVGDRFAEEIRVTCERGTGQDG